MNHPHTHKYHISFEELEIEVEPKHRAINWSLQTVFRKNFLCNVEKCRDTLYWRDNSNYICRSHTIYFFLSVNCKYFILCHRVSISDFRFENICLFKNNWENISAYIWVHLTSDNCICQTSKYISLSTFSFFTGSHLPHPQNNHSRIPLWHAISPCCVF